MRYGLVSPLDDAYITYQYARQMAQGHPYQYNTGDPPTTGMTSPLFGFLLAGIYRVKLAQEQLPSLVIGLGVLWLGLIALLTYRLADHIVLGNETIKRRWGLLAALLVLLTGSLQWGSFNGMETGLFTVLTLAALDAFLGRGIAWCALWLGLAGLTRPGGLVLSIVIWATEFALGVVHSRSIRWKNLAILSASVLAGLVPSLINWMLTGATASSALHAKSWLYNVPFYSDQAVRTIWWTYRRILKQFTGLGAPSHWLVAPGVLSFAFIGWVTLGLRHRWRAMLLLVWWLFGGTLALATLITATWHQGRYLTPFVPVITVIATRGISFLWECLDRRWQHGLWAGVACLLFVFSLYSTLQFARLYRRSVSTMSRQHMTVARWIRDHLPANARIGITDAGILRYVSERPTYDVVGLTTPDAAIAWRNGSGSQFEQMEHSPMRPDYFATRLPYFTSTDIYGEELFKVTLDDHFGSASRVLGVWRADWQLAGSGDHFYQPDILSRTSGLQLVDALDVADLEAESLHDVTWWEDVRRGGFATEMKQFSYRVLPNRVVLDGGRLLTGGIAFDVATKPHQPLWIVARLHAQHAGAVQVDVDGHDVGRWAYPPVPGEWLETIFRVPAETVTRAQTRITLTVDTGHYDPYFFWFLQGQPEEVTVEIQHRTEAAFGETLSLLGFDLPERAWHPGDILPVTLYWQAQAPTESDAQVFLHLYDADGTLGPQSDGWPFHGTRPPYTWAVDEIVADPRELPLPADLPAGEHALAVGLYYPDGAGRLPAYLNSERQPEDRVPLATIHVME
jgi:hypothetical protein